MRTTQFKVLEEVNLNNPIFIEALPGIGHVGKLAIDHVIDELKATKFVEIYSPYFPPQVLVGEGGVIEDMVNEMYYLKSDDEEGHDFIFLVGNCQGLSPEGQYELCGSVLDFVESLGAREIYTLGGLATGQPVDGDRVLGAATDEARIELLKEADIGIRSADGGIVGASGLFLGLGRLRGMSGSCLMGKTPGYFIDAEAAEAVLEKLSILVNIEVNTDKLEERAQETREMISKAQQMEQEMMNRAMGQQPQSQDDLRYIG
ncbi:MAG: proteasome assembly chaperone family protein [archaeon]|nr:proteasome assembly chaperone family protein [archaeon]